MVFFVNCADWRQEFQLIKWSENIWRENKRNILIWMRKEIEFCFTEKNKVVQKWEASKEIERKSEEKKREE